MAKNDAMDILAEAREKAEFIEKNRWIYKNSGTKTSFSAAKKVKYCNCSAYVCYILQALKILKPGQMFYGNRLRGITYRGTGTKEAVKRHFHIIKVGRTATEYANRLKPGDICCYTNHTCIYAGSNERGLIWWDAGKAATRTGKSGSHFVKIHRAQRLRGQKINYILRLRG